MPQQQQIVWSQLKVGLLTVVSLVILIVAIFLVTGQTGFLTKMIAIRTFAPDAGGLKSGAPVRVAGVDAGSVKRVQISGRSEPSQAVEVDMVVSHDFQKDIRTDSEASVAAEGLLGERYIDISQGSASAPSISPGATIPFHSTAEFSELVGGSRDLLDNLNLFATRMNTVIGKLESGQGTVGKLLEDETLYDRINSTVDELQKFAGDLSTGKGSLGMLLSSDELYQRLDATLKQLQDVSYQLENGQGTLAKLIRDPELYNKTDQLISHGTLLVDNINQGKGTLGKLAQDEELYRRLNTATENLNNVLASIQNSQGTVGRLLHDPSLYDNLNSTSLEVRGLLADFRQNPKKFLTIHFRVF